MSEQQKRTYELNDPAILFILRLRMNRQIALEVLAEMKPYSELAMIELLNEKDVEMRDVPDEDAMDLVTGSPKRDREFFDRHCIKLSMINRDRPKGLKEGEPVPPPQLVPMTRDQIEAADIRFRIKPAIVAAGYNGISNEKSDDVLSFDDAILSAFATEVPVPSFMMLAVDGFVEERVDLVHVFRMFSPENASAWDKAKKVRRLQRGTKIIYNHHEIVRLYKETIVRAEGFTIGGAPCVQSNREEWIHRIPYLNKLDAVTRYFGETSRKNG